MCPKIIWKTRLHIEMIRIPQALSLFFLSAREQCISSLVASEHQTYLPRRAFLIHPNPWFPRVENKINKEIHTFYYISNWTLLPPEPLTLILAEASLIIIIIHSVCLSRSIEKQFLTIKHIHFMMNWEQYRYYKRMHQTL